jgi:hypothetical protein
MTNEEKGRVGTIDPFYGQPIGSRRLEIQKLHYKLHNKHHKLCMGIHKKYERSFERINGRCREIAPQDALRWLFEQGYFDLLAKSGAELEILRESPLGRIVYIEPGEIFDRSDHENMLDASDGLFRLDSDPVIERVLTDDIYEKGLRKRQRHRADIYGRRLQKHVYERYLSEAVGRPITVEEYEREFGFLSDKGEAK